MSKLSDYKTLLASTTDWLPYLGSQSGLPGPRGNLELARAVAETASRERLEELLRVDLTNPPENTPETFIVFCGVSGLGKFAAEDASILPRLKSYARDSRWRIREAVAMSLQLWGETDMPAVLSELKGWIGADPLEMRAAAAAICEPALLKDRSCALSALDLMDEITRAFLLLSERSSDPVRTLRQGLAYCWSVAVAAAPDTGKPLMEKWIAVNDPDIRWLMAENLKKNRLIRLDPVWTAGQAENIRR